MSRFRLAALAIGAILHQSAAIPPAAARSLYVFASSGTYVTVDSGFNRSEARRLSDSDLRILDAADAGVPGRYAFLRTALPSSDRESGFLIIDLAAGRLVATLSEVAESETTAIAADPAGKRIYLTFVPPQAVEGKTVVERTMAFDAATFARTGNWRDSPLAIRPSSCFVSERLLYTDHRFVSVVSRRVTKTGALHGRPLVPVACRAGRELALSISAQSQASLSLYDVRSDRILNQFNTGVTVLGLVPREWAFTGDGVRAIRDETISVAVGGGRALEQRGRLTVWNALSGEREGEIAIDVSGTPTTGRGLLATNADGDRAFYRAGQALWVVDVKSRTILRKIELPFAPVGVAE